jgi:hypothetical protein
MGCLTRDTGQRESPGPLLAGQRERESKATFFQPFPFASIISHICLLPSLFVVVPTKPRVTPFHLLFQPTVQLTVHY